uniref:Uncharacterized protein n=1 Tax=Romanomermis culicivorax TaxID=13658 RepID=A0A915I7D1_ROMCU
MAALATLNIPPQSSLMDHQEPLSGHCNHLNYELLQFAAVFPLPSWLSWLQHVDADNSWKPNPNSRKTDDEVVTKEP